MCFHVFECTNHKRKWISSSTSSAAQKLFSLYVIYTFRVINNKLGWSNVELDNRHSAQHSMSWYCRNVANVELDIEC